MPGFDSEFLDILQLAYNQSVARLSPGDETIGEHVCEVVAQAVISSAKEGTVDVDRLISRATIAGRRVLQAERFLPTAA
jgi:phage I-like protein